MNRNGGFKPPARAMALSKLHSGSGDRRLRLADRLTVAYPAGVDEVIREKLEAFIRRKRLRRTSQRDQIIAEVFSKDEHFSADELFERVRRSDETASRATVYRTISLLVEADLLRQIDLGDDQTTYDPNFVDKPSHNHLVCIDCGKVVEFEDPGIDVLSDCVTRRLGFKAVRQSVKIEATCEQLRQKGRCPNLIQRRLSGRRLRKKR